MRLFVPRDIDGFFGLFIDNLVQILLIAYLCSRPDLGNMTGEYAYLIDARILPAAAVSILIGNLFYSAQAFWVARRERRSDVTALPYGINTPSLIAFVYFVIAPIARNDALGPEAAWRMGLVACLGSGIIELAGAFVAPWIRKYTPRAALLSTLAGIAIGFISMSFALEMWARPLVALAPLAIVLITYFSGIRFPFHLPGGLIAVLVGSAIAWLPVAATGITMSPSAVVNAAEQTQARWPVWCGGELWDTLRHPADWVPYLSIIIPMGLFNLIGSLQNIESAEASGDRFSTRWSLATNGVGTIMAALLGSCFPTTIYIGHPGWKRLGARSSYSALNGMVIAAICFAGAVPLMRSLIPMEAGYAIVLWIGIIITAQAFQATPSRHAPAVAAGLFPAIAAWGAIVAIGAWKIPAIRSADVTLQGVLNPADPSSVTLEGFSLHGLIVLEQGYIFTCMILAAITAALIDRKFFAATVWSAIAVMLTVVGLMHAFEVSGQDVDYLMIWEHRPPSADAGLLYRGYDIAAGYLLMALVFLGVGYYTDRFREPDLQNDVLEEFSDPPEIAGKK